MSRVFQLLPVYAYGDAIGGAVRETGSMLRECGFETATFAGLIDSRLQAVPAERLWSRLSPDDVVMYHLSIGSDLARRLHGARCRKVLVYHNITPPEYLEESSPLNAYRARLGRRDLSLLAPVADLVICDSAFNMEEALGAGAHRAEVVPPPVDFARLRPVAAEPAVPPALLFVGRLAPNKCHADLIRVLAAVRAGAEPDARLQLIGTRTDNEAYARRLQRLTERLGVATSVHISPAHTGDAELRGYYRNASIFVCASEHEGFCVPLLEAMAFSLPIVAFAAGAVPDTLGGAGVVLNHKDPLVWAAVIERIIHDPQLREQLAAKGRDRLRHFSHDVVRDKLVSALKGIGVAPD